MRARLKRASVWEKDLPLTSLCIAGPQVEAQLKRALVWEKNLPLTSLCIAGPQVEAQIIAQEENRHYTKQ